MAMKVRIRSSDVAPGRAVPWPVLEAGNGSFVGGVYRVSLRRRGAGRSFSLIHDVENAALITNWIREGKVKFVCTVAAPVSAYRKVHVSVSSEQEIEWQPDDLGSHPLFTPMIVTARDLRHEVDAARDGLDPLWHGKVLSLYKGSRVAICSTFALQSGLFGLLDFRLRKDFAPGRFKVEPSHEEGSNSESIWQRICSITSGIAGRSCRDETS